jgi:enolase
MILPVGASSFSEALRMGAETYHALAGVIKETYGRDATNVGDEGGFAPNILDNREGLALLQKAIAAAGYEGKIKIGMDVAASEFYVEGTGMYDLDFKNPQSDPAVSHVTGAKLAEMYVEWAKEFPIVSIEDAFDQDDWASWTDLLAKMPRGTQ